MISIIVVVALGSSRLRSGRSTILDLFSALARWILVELLAALSRLLGEQRVILQIL